MSEPRPIKALVRVLGETLLEIAARMEADEIARADVAAALARFDQEVKARIEESLKDEASPITQAFRQLSGGRRSCG